MDGLQKMKSQETEQAKAYFRIVTVSWVEVSSIE